MRHNRDWHQTGTREPFRDKKRTFPIKQIFLPHHPLPSRFQFGPCFPCGMFHDRVADIAKPKGFGACTKGPLHVFRYGVPEWADGIENFTPDEHIAGTCKSDLVDITLKVKRENHFE